MNIDLSQFKKIADDPNSSTLKHVSDGHEIKLQKKALSRNQVGALSKLELHMAEGGQGLGADEEEERAEDPHFNTQYPDAVPANLSDDDSDDDSDSTQQASNQPTPHTVININNPSAGQNQPAVQTSNGAQTPQAPQETQGPDLNAPDRYWKNPDNPGTFDFGLFQLDHFKDLPDDTKNKVLDRILPNINGQQSLDMLPPDIRSAAMNRMQQAASADQRSQATAQSRAQKYQALQSQLGSGLPQAHTQIAEANPIGQSVSSYGQQYSEGAAQQQQGLQQQADTLGQIGKAQGDVEEQSANDTQEMVDDYQDHIQNWNQKLSDLSDDILTKGAVDPKRIFNQMNGFQKFSLGVGLILGDVGGAITRQPNQSLKFLDDMMDKDILAQRVNLESKNNLLGVMSQQTRNLTDAMSATKAAYWDIATRMMDAKAKQMSDPMAQAQVNQTIGQIKMEKIAPFVQQQSLKDALFNRQQSQGQGSKNQRPLNPVYGSNPQETAQAIQYGGILPNDAVKPALQEVGDAQKDTQFRDNVMDMFNRLSKERTVSGIVGHPVDVGATDQNLINSTLGEMAKQSAGRYNDADANMLGGLFKTYGRSGQSVAQLKTRLNQFFNERMAYPNLSSIGVNPMNWGRYPSDASGKPANMQNQGPQSPFQGKVKLGPPVMNP